MEDVHRRAIQSNYVSLVEQTDLDLMVSALYEKGVFTEQMIERYNDTQKDVRQRKRQLYRDITSRGPDAFEHLVEALTEAGYWDLARALDPNSHLHTSQEPPRNPRPSRIPDEKPFISISSGRKKPKAESEPVQATSEEGKVRPKSSENEHLGDASEIPHFAVKKSMKYCDNDDEASGIKAYRTRDRQRGVLLIFNYKEFAHGVEEPRRGADVDCVKLKYLFDEMGFIVRLYLNCTKKETVNALESLRTNDVVVEAGCVFVVVASHGYGRANTFDNDFRCYDGTLMSTKDFLQYFNNVNLPELEGVAKVFIFQICRGSEWAAMQMPLGSTASDGAPFAAAPPPAPRAPPTPRDKRARVYSDILIAHSTVPGYVSYRDSRDGSWYIQVLCEVFARYAHERDVVELFTLVDQQLEERFLIQTSSIERWGFNRRLYLHPGLRPAPA